MPTYRIDIAYDGSGFRGYARNAGVRSVQETLEDFLSRMAGEPVDTVVAGRTDAGVHARQNVVSFSTGATLDPERLRRAITSTLGPEIVVRSASVVPDDFHARFSAGARAYRYFVDDSGTPDPLRRGSVWAVRWPLDVERMDAAAAAFVGDHDFASLCRRQEGRSTERTVLDATWERAEDGVAVYRVAATAFCHQMVRSMVALCVDVGRGAVEADDVPAILAARDRNAARGAAPPHGLVLWRVTY